MDVAPAFERQAVACEELGSPLYAELIRRLVDDYELGGVSTKVLAGHEDDPGPSALALRLLGSVHRLVLQGSAPELAEFYPSTGGTWDPVLGWEAFEQVLHTHRDQVRVLLHQPPQTNEVGRSLALYGGLRHLVSMLPMPVRLLEIGTSAGLNLRADAFRYELPDGTGYGPVDSPVVFTDAWAEGRPVPVGPDPVIVERVGSDIAPIDPLSDEGALTLAAYVWPDQLRRLERLRGALEVARQIPAELRCEDALSFLRGIELVDGHITLIWHSIMWQYLSRDDRTEALEVIERLGERATSSAALAHLSLEPARRTPDSEYEYLVTLQVWPGGPGRVLGHASPHGIPTVFEA